MHLLLESETIKSLKHTYKKDGSFYLNLLILFVQIDTARNVFSWKQTGRRGGEAQVVSMIDGN